jgi:c-di-GMP-binding flagellar brake protein YcgR
VSEQLNARSETLAEPADISQYLVRSPREILFLLRQLTAKKSLISVFFDGGQSALLSLLDVDEDDGTLTLDVAPEEQLNARLQRSTKLACETQLDRVQIRFQLAGPLASAQFEGGPALSAHVPEAVLRLQRREHYRIVTPISQPLRCLIPMRDAKGTKIFEARVLDVSGGGIALAAPTNGAEFNPGMQFESCKLEIPDSPPLVMKLLVRNLFKVTQINGTELVRAGCQFVGLTPAQEAALQRYILRLERERAGRTP